MPTLSLRTSYPSVRATVALKGLGERLPPDSLFVRFHSPLHERKSACFVRLRGLRLRPEQAAAEAARHAAGSESLTELVAEARRKVAEARAAAAGSSSGETSTSRGVGSRPSTLPSASASHHTTVEVAAQPALPSAEVAIDTQQPAGGGKKEKEASVKSGRGSARWTRRERRCR
jgi:hypothetical protein